jgi:hypothetical protein
MPSTAFFALWSLAISCSPPHFLLHRPRIGLGHLEFWAYTVDLSSLLLLFSYEFNSLLGVLAFGGRFGAVNRKGLALLECARRIRVLAWDVLMFLHWLLVIRFWVPAFIFPYVFTALVFFGLA